MLTEIKIRAIKPSGRIQKLYDEKGLYLFVTPKGGKYWRFDFRYGGKRKTLSFGVYPEVSLKEARQRRDEARASLRDGVDPAQKKKKIETDTKTFRDIAEQWYKDSHTKWKASHSKTIKYRLDLYILPALGGHPINAITRRDLLAFIKGIETSGKKETARRIKQIISNIYEYALDLELTDKNPTNALSKHLSSPKPNHFPTLLDPDTIGKLIRDIDNYSGDFIVKSALKVLAYTFVRPGELRFARWSEIMLDRGIWDIPAERMKTGKDHRVFLSRQVLEILNNLKLLTGYHKYVFRGRGLKPISNMTLNRALQRMGYDTKKEITAHGFRAMARTLIHEKLGYPPEVIEHQLAHAVPDILGEAYNRTKFMDQRQKMMQDWADYLDSLEQQT